MMMVLAIFNIIRLVCITTTLIASFIATILLIYEISGATACPTNWKQDTKGQCSIREELNTQISPVSGFYQNIKNPLNTFL
jgi:hypothetical protein